MYRVIYYVHNNTKAREFNTLAEAFEFWRKLPFQTFRELYKIGS